MENQNIRQRITDSGLKYWQVADATGISACTLCVWLRKPLTDKQLARIEAAIDRLTGGVDVGASKRA